MRMSVFLIGASLLAAPALAQESAPAAAVQPGAPNVTAGATVIDTSGGAVGTIASVANGNATIDTGTVKAAVPVGSFAKGENGLILAMTKVQLEAAAAKASKPVELAVGKQIVGPKGNAVGTIAAVNGDLVTVQTPTTKVQLPKTAFAQAADGALAIGLTQEQLEAAVKSAPKPS